MRLRIRSVRKLSRLEMMLTLWYSRLRELFQMLVISFQQQTRARLRKT